MAGTLYRKVADFDSTGWRWPHFTPLELSCRCGRHCQGEYFHDPAFLDALETLRRLVRRPLVLTSARRCALHNTEVGGAPLSQHRLSLAVDISVANWLSDKARLRDAAMTGGFTGFGFGTHFLHLDRRPMPAGKRAMWDYANGGYQKWTSYR